MVKQDTVREWLQRLRKRFGLRLFALTNAAFPHANSLMTFSFGEAWTQLFDIVIVEAKKRTFFAPPLHLASGATPRASHLKPFRRLNKSGGRTRVARGETVLPTLGGVFAGGNFSQLMDFFARATLERHDGYPTCAHGWVLGHTSPEAGAADAPRGGSRSSPATPARSTKQAEVRDGTRPAGPARAGMGGDHVGASAGAAPTTPKAARRPGGTTGGVSGGTGGVSSSCNSNANGVSPPPSARSAMARRVALLRRTPRGKGGGSADRTPAPPPSSPPPDRRPPTHTRHQPRRPHMLHVNSDATAAGVGGSGSGSGGSGGGGGGGGGGVGAAAAAVPSLRDRMTCGVSPNRCFCGARSRPVDAKGKDVAVCYFGDHVPQDVVLAHTRGWDVVAVQPDILPAVSLFKASRASASGRAPLATAFKWTAAALSLEAQRGAGSNHRLRSQSSHNAAGRARLAAGRGGDDDVRLSDPARVTGWGSCLHGTGPAGSSGEFGASHVAAVAAPPSFVSHLWMGSAVLAVPSVDWFARHFPSAGEPVTDTRVASVLKLPKDVCDVLLPGHVPQSLASRLCKKMPGSGAAASGVPPSGPHATHVITSRLDDEIAAARRKHEKRAPHIDARHPVHLPSPAPRKVVVAAANCLSGGVFTSAESSMFFPVSRRQATNGLGVAGAPGVAFRARGNSGSGDTATTTAATASATTATAATATAAAGCGVVVVGAAARRPQAQTSAGVCPDNNGRWKWLAVLTATRLAMGAAGDPSMEMEEDAGSVEEEDDRNGSSGSAASRIVSSLGSL